MVPPVGVFFAKVLLKYEIPSCFGIAGRGLAKIMISKMMGGSKMNKKWLTGMLAGVMFCGWSFFTSSVYAHDDSAKEKSSPCPPLSQQAKHWGIDTRGKTDLEIKRELQKKWEKRILEHAKRWGINIQGKTREQIKQELRKKWKEQGMKPNGKWREQILEHAKRWGIDTQGKTTEQIRQELRKRRKECEEFYFKTG